MGDAGNRTRTKAYILNRDPGMDERLYQLGQEDVTIHGLAAEFGCSKDTVQTFFRREPEARACYDKGKREAREGARQIKRLVYNDPRGRGRVKLTPGEVCSHCGQRGLYANGEPVVAISLKDLTGARAKLERLLDNSLYDD